MLQVTPIELSLIALVGVMLVVPLGGMLKGRLLKLSGIDGSFSDGAFTKSVLFVIIVVLGVSAWILTPVLPFLVLIGLAKFLPLEGRTRTGLLITGCLSIGLGAALTSADLACSQIAALKLLGSPYQSTISRMFGP